MLLLMTVKVTKSTVSVTGYEHIYPLIKELSIFTIISTYLYLILHNYHKPIHRTRLIFISDKNIGF